jgi:hypothetical protein
MSQCSATIAPGRGLGDLVGRQAGLFERLALQRLPRALAQGHAAADQVVEHAGVGGFVQAALRHPQVRGSAQRVGHVAVAMRAQRQRAPEARSRALDGGVADFLVVPHAVGLVAPGDDQALGAQLRVHRGPVGVDGPDVAAEVQGDGARVDADPVRPGGEGAQVGFGDAAHGHRAMRAKQDDGATRDNGVACGAQGGPRGGDG